MFFPIGDINIKHGAKPLFTYLFIAVNIGVFVYQFLLPPAQQQAFVMEYGSIPAEITRLRICKPCSPVFFCTEGGCIC